MQWARNDGNQQQCQFVDAGSGYYQLQVPAQRQGPRVPERQRRRAGHPGHRRQQHQQHFAVADSASGYVRFINRHSSKALDVWEWSTADGGMISQYADLDGCEPAAGS